MISAGNGEGNLELFAGCCYRRLRCMYVGAYVCVCVMACMQCKGNTNQRAYTSVDGCLLAGSCHVCGLGLHAARTGGRRPPGDTLPTMSPRAILCSLLNDTTVRYADFLSFPFPLDNGFLSFLFFFQRRRGQACSALRLDNPTL